MYKMPNQQQTEQTEQPQLTSLEELNNTFKQTLLDIQNLNKEVKTLSSGVRRLRTLSNREIKQAGRRRRRRKTTDVKTI